MDPMISCSNKNAAIQVFKIMKSCIKPVYYGRDNIKENLKGLSTTDIFQQALYYE